LLNDFNSRILAITLHFDDETGLIAKPMRVYAEILRNSVSAANP
jgi:hypothetical protein